MPEKHRSGTDQQQDSSAAPREPDEIDAPERPGPDKPAAADVGAGDAALDDGGPSRRETQPPDPSIVGEPGHGNGPAAPPTAAEDAVAVSDAGNPADSATADTADAEAEHLARELTEARDKHLRLAAEFDNYRKRVIREREEAHTRAQAEVLAKLVDVLDDLDRVAHFSEETPAAALLEGFQLVERKLQATLSAIGMEPLDAAGKAFDPEQMEALATVPAESPEEDNRVADVFQKGYAFRGVLVRPARVRVKQFES
jgi:molecular chaperone GrpE